MVCVRPGVLLLRAGRLRPASALRALDLPTFERPANAISGGPSGSRSAARAAEARKAACERSLMTGAGILIKSRLSHFRGQGDDARTGARRGIRSRVGRAGARP